MTPPASALRAAGAGIRGLYLWAGEATIDLQRVKYPDIPVDEDAHRRAHAASSARTLAAEGFNLAFLSMNWGFPPEAERGHWRDFTVAAANYRAAGFTAIGYVQASNCLAEGSYASKDWYAVTPRGRRIPYFRNRLMTCWNHEGWIEEVRAHVLRALRSGADGVFFDNIWMGGTPWMLGGVPGGFAGCACERCRAAFRDECGHSVPARLRGDRASEAWLDWRAAVLARRLSDWAASARAQKPDALVFANNCDVILRDSRRLFGLDPARLAPVQDGLLVENVAMPHHDRRRRRLVSNAIPVRALRALVPDRRVLSVTYEHGIGFDRPPSPLRALRTVAEAAALGAIPVLKASEYLDRAGRFTVFTANEFAGLRARVAGLLRWLDTNDGLYRDVVPDPDIGVLWDTTRFADDFSHAARHTFGLATQLIAAGVPFSFATSEMLERGGMRGLRVLVPCGSTLPQRTGGATLVPVPSTGIPFRAPRGGGLTRRLLNGPLSTLSRVYFGSARARRAIDNAGLTAWFLRSPWFRLPRDPSRLRGRVPEWSPLRAVSDAPVLVERTRRPDGTRLVHLVNFEDEPITVRFPGIASRQPTLHTPDDGTAFEGERALEVRLELYAVLEFG